MNRQHQTKGTQQSSVKKYRSRIPERLTKRRESIADSVPSSVDDPLPAAPRPRPPHLEDPPTAAPRTRPPRLEDSSPTTPRAPPHHAPLAWTPPSPPARNHGPGADSHLHASTHLPRHSTPADRDHHRPKTPDTPWTLNRKAKTARERKIPALTNQNNKGTAANKP